jgi:hypothetical protein
MEETTYVFTKNIYIFAKSSYAEIRRNTEEGEVSRSYISDIGNQANKRNDK